MNARSPILLFIALAATIGSACGLESVETDALDEPEVIVQLSSTQALVADREPEAADPPAAGCLPIPVYCAGDDTVYSDQCEATAHGQPPTIDLVDQGDFGRVFGGPTIDPADPPFFFDPGFAHDPALDSEGDWDVAPVFTANSRTIHDRGTLDGELGGEYLLMRGVAGTWSQRDFWCQEVAVEQDTTYSVRFSGVSFKNHATNMARVTLRLGGTTLLDTGGMHAPDGWVDYSTTFEYTGSDDTLPLCLRQIHYANPSNLVGVDEVAMIAPNCTPVAP